ncbi:Molybdenum cofactor sulfurase C-terminal [Penicillium hispanicum]|uniref:Molybdenum cofactor sulfurase C-terminal n=1 Tax=Penicillium hispanicum TaxID=1080232 RepID=UPI00254013FB|nr:Molybdenum cofactor sulfurase C-terminal [Penicillium hispanicum]KAJ5585497.1 Molybdenum cofactor sulfurase C-terminal [Penicillium hispanicum]
MLESIPTISILVLGLAVLLPLLLLTRLKGWTQTSQSTSASILPRLRLWRRRPKQSSEIVSLRMYPIKSCRGFEVQRTTLKEHGLDLDRRWMLVDANTHEFLTIRQIPDMTRIGTGLSAEGDDLLITIPTSSAAANAEHACQTIRIPAHPSPTWLAANTAVAPVKIWDNDTDGYVYRDDVNAPFSAFLGRAVALVYKGPTPRVLKGNGAPTRLGRVQTTGFPDVFPILIASEASLSELNSRLRLRGVDPITVERFRPNIVVRGETPWSEDSWKLVRIHGTGSDSETSGPTAKHAPLDLDIVARCARCQVPNVDPDTAAKHKKQPWDTLVSYRRVDEGIKYKPCFGMLSAPRNEGAVEVGMRLEVLEETTKHRYITGW